MWGETGRAWKITACMCYFGALCHVACAFRMALGLNARLHEARPLPGEYSGGQSAGGSVEGGQQRNL